MKLEAVSLRFGLALCGRFALYIYELDPFSRVVTHFRIKGEKEKEKLAKEKRTRK